ncbi:MAG: FctA domain-containing protein, partial [Escherichia coli]|nr:FctA domain-containing protein [Escherichia coli]
MKLSKTIGRVAATFLATAMLASISAVSALAEGEQFNGTTNTDGDYTVTMQKVVKVPGNVYAPNATFSFTATANYEAETFNGIPVETTTNGTPAAVTVSDATFTSSATAATNNEYTQNFTITVDLSQYSHAGVYKYLLKETVGNKTGITYDTQEKYLYVIIENGQNGALSVAGVVVKNKADNTTTDAGKSTSFTNSYIGATPDADTTDLTLTKTISGASANKNQEFSFTISIDNGTAGQTGSQDNQVFKYWNDANKNNTEEEGETGTVTANGDDLTLSLGNGEKVVIYGLRSGDTYTITEANVTGGKTADGYTVKINGTADNATGVNNGTVANADISVNYENVRDSVTPTGLVMDIAPYILL